MPQSESDVPQSDEEESEAGSEDDGDTYVVEQILSEMQEDNGNRLYLVRWEGYGSDGDTWEPEDVSTGHFQSRSPFYTSPARTAATAQDAS